jgi:hypothetical protein
MYTIVYVASWFLDPVAALSSTPELQNTGFRLSSLHFDSLHAHGSKVLSPVLRGQGRTTYDGYTMRGQ